MIDGKRGGFMKFITKEIYYSMQFFSYYLVEEDVSDSYCKSIEVQTEYKFYMNRNFNALIFEYQKVKTILFDKNGNLNDLNVKLFYKILEIAKSYEDYEKEMFLLVEESAQKIQSGNYADEIKHLAELNYHDSHILEIVYEKGVFTVAFDDYAWDRVSTYSFKTEKISCDISLSELLAYQVLYEEVFFHSSDNLFEYNLLLIKCGYGKEADQIEEISIIFSEIVSLTHEERQEFLSRSKK